MNYTFNPQMKHFNLLVSETDAAYHEAAQKLGMSDSTMLILYVLGYSEGECLLSDLTSSMSKQTINSALRKLEAEEIVYLKALEGRKKKVCLTPKGEELMQKTAFQVIRVENEIFDTWSEEEKNTYLELTRRYLTAFKEKTRELKR